MERCGGDAVFLALLPAVGASVASVWAAAFVAMPRKPLPNNEVQELVYSRLLGRQHRVIIFAAMVTALGLLALALSLPADIATRAGTTAAAQQLCFSGSTAPPICYTPQP